MEEKNSLAYTIEFNNSNNVNNINEPFHLVHLNR